MFQKSPSSIYRCSISSNAIISPFPYLMAIAEGSRLYYRLASGAQKRAADAPVRANALAYLRLYRKIIDEEFPALKDLF